MTFDRIVKFIGERERRKILDHASFINNPQTSCAPCYGMYHNVQKPLLVLRGPSTDTQLLLNSIGSTKRIRK